MLNNKKLKKWLMSITKNLLTSTALANKDIKSSKLKEGASLQTIWVYLAEILFLSTMEIICLKIEIIYKILMLKINKIKELFKIILIKLWIEKNLQKILMEGKGLLLLEIKKAEISF